MENVTLLTSHNQSPKYAHKQRQVVPFISDSYNPASEGYEQIGTIQKITMVDQFQGDQNPKGDISFNSDNDIISNSIMSKQKKTIMNSEKKPRK